MKTTRNINTPSRDSENYQ